ncbi:hypothetical protein [Amycolatopsis sp. cg9]|uniref:hypothetical protein n=1 Tax=Amycolatopsis sp. cg9 TaxID=3238801 RepID=UPI003523159F
MEELALVVNVRNRWPEVQRGEATAQDVALGDWNLETRKIDPGRVVCVYAAHQKRIVAAFAVTNPQTVPGYPEPRVRFQARLRLSHLEGQTSPHIWQRGERYPVIAIPLDELPGDLADFEGKEHVELAGYTLCVHPDGNATVLAPAGRTVSVRSLPEDSDNAGGIRPGGITKTSATIDVSALSDRARVPTPTGYGHE